MANKVQGQVVEVSESGDLLTDITLTMLDGAPHDERLKILIDEHETVGLFQEEHGQPSLTLIAVLGADQRLRLHLVDESASMMLGISRGAAVTASW